MAGLAQQVFWAENGPEPIQPDAVESFAEAEEGAGGLPLQVQPALEQGGGSMDREPDHARRQDRDLQAGEIDGSLDAHPGPPNTAFALDALHALHRRTGLA